ncbi:MAG: DegT/DnrJ/EryC1/StrS family aminotransferase [Candidatus Promineifilaceae bacterium]
MMQVPFVDLAAAYEAQKSAIDEAIQRVLAGGRYILGKEVEQFEQAFAAYCDSAHAVGVASGTDALLLALKALNIGPGHEVITVAHTAVATAAAIVLSGAKPVFVDIDPRTFTLDPSLLPGALSSRTRAVIPVHLYGQTADMDPLRSFAKTHKLAVIEDCAQAHGATYGSHIAGSMGDAAAFSFYPTKNLGAIGDGGAVVCQDEAAAGRLRELRQYGWRERYISEEVGMNSRLDELQAAILRVRLASVDADNDARRRVSSLYDELLADTPLELPREADGRRHVYHLYVVQAPNRQALRAYLAKKGIATAVHYPLPVHLQPAYIHLGRGPGSLPVSERTAESVLSLPIFPQMEEAQVAAVAKAIGDFYRSAS